MTLKASTKKATQILSVASEIFPLVKTGGLADVVGAMPSALAAYNCNVITLIPAYSSIIAKLGKGEPLHKYDNLFGTPATLVRHNVNGLDVIAVHSPFLYEREGGPYIDTNGNDWGDNPIRFAALSKVAADLAGGICPQFLPDIVHAHDWQAALACVYMKYGNERAQKTPSVLTIHNIAFQGKFNGEVFSILQLPSEVYRMDGVEYYGDISFLKGGIAKAYAITTVSPTYSREILQSEFGMGMEGIIQAREGQVYGILNGIDDHIWNPETDTYIEKNYHSKNLLDRKFNKRQIETLFNIKRAATPIFCIISRLTWQKGMDVFIEALPDIIKSGSRIAVLGTGETYIQEKLKQLSREYAGKLGIYIGYDEKLSHLLQAGSDGIIIPSRFEPCGLTQLYALKYGCVPIVSRTGGLADTIIDANDAAMNANVATGFQFNKVTYHELLRAVNRAIPLYHDKRKWAQIQRNGMKADFSWKKSGEKYAEIYKNLLKANSLKS